MTPEPRLRSAVTHADTEVFETFVPTFTDVNK